MIHKVLKVGTILQYSLHKLDHRVPMVDKGSLSKMNEVQNFVDHIKTAHNTTYSLVTPCTFRLNIFVFCRRYGYILNAKWKHLYPPVTSVKLSQYVLTTRPITQLANNLR